MQGNLGVICRALVHDVFLSTEDTVLIFNYHPSIRAGVGQIICPKKNAKLVTDELKKRSIHKLPETHHQMGLSPRNNYLGERRMRALQRHRESTLRSWERWRKSPREEPVPQLFERLIDQAKELLIEKKEKEDSEDNSFDKGQTGSPNEGARETETESGRINKENHDPNLPRNWVLQNIGKPKPLGRNRRSALTPQRDEVIRQKLDAMAEDPKNVTGTEARKLSHAL